MIFEKDYNMHAVFFKKRNKMQKFTNKQKKKRKTNKTPANLSLKCLKGKKYYIIVKTLARI